MITYSLVLSQEGSERKSSEASAEEIEARARPGADDRRRRGLPKNLFHELNTLLSPPYYNFFYSVGQQDKKFNFSSKIPANIFLRTKIIDKTQSLPGEIFFQGSIDIYPCLFQFMLFITCSFSSSSLILIIISPHGMG